MVAKTRKYNYAYKTLRCRTELIEVIMLYVVIIYKMC